MSRDRVRGLVIAYLQGEMPAGRLEAELPDGWELDEAGDPGLRELTFQVMGPLAEYDRGDLDEHELRERLLPHVGWVVGRVDPLPSVVTTSVTRDPAPTVAAGTALLKASA
jgi:hypothetical protein